MEQRGTPVRKTHTSTADLLSWPEGPTFDNNSPHRPLRNFLPSDGITKVVFGGQVTDEEFESMLKRKPRSENKRREMTGSSIFAGEGEDNDQEAEGASATPSNKSGVRMYQQTVAGMSQISFATDENATPKKPATLPEAAKQRELSGNLDNISEAKLKKQFSDAKYKELSGTNIFAPPPEMKPRDVQASAAFRQTNPEPVLKTAKKIHDQKLAQLSGNNIFKADSPPLNPAEKPLSTAKLRDMSGNDIFSDGKAESRVFSGVRKPPGGESSISLV